MQHSTELEQRLVIRADRTTSLSVRSVVTTLLSWNIISSNVFSLRLSARGEVVFRRPPGDDHYPADRDCVGINLASKVKIAT